MRARYIAVPFHISFHSLWCGDPADLISQSSSCSYLPSSFPPNTLLCAIWTSGWANVFLKKKFVIGNDAKIKCGQQSQIWGVAIRKIFLRKVMQQRCAHVYACYSKRFQLFPPQMLVFITEVVRKPCLRKPLALDADYLRRRKHSHEPVAIRFFSSDFLQQWCPVSMRKILPWYAPPGNSPTFSGNMSSCHVIDIGRARFWFIPKKMWSHSTPVRLTTSLNFM